VRPRAGGPERRLTGDTVRAISQYFWAQDGRRLIYLQDRGGNENFHLHVVRVDDADTRAVDMTPFENVRAFVFEVPYEDPSRILIGMNRRDPQLFDAHWLDLATGKLTMVGENPGRFGSFVADRALKVRLATAQATDGGTEIHVRDDERSPWRLVAKYPAAAQVNALRFHPDGKRVYLSSDAGESDLAQLQLLDLATGVVAVVEQDPRGEVDFGNAIFSERTDSLLATVYDADTTRIYPKAEWMRVALADIRRLSAGTPTLTSTTRDERLWVVSFDNPVDPGATYLYDRATRRAEFLYRPRPWLKPASLAPMRPVTFAARDGLTIHAYLTTPTGIPARGLPTVLLVHGGPWARDAYGYDPEAQLLANRGYAVLQVNYRGSTGYGKKFYNAAVHEFGRKMHDDLIDGVRWVVREGIADSARVGIYGGSYGGYATLVGVTFTPDVFRAAIDYVGPSSLITLIQSFPAYWRPFLEGTWFRFVGDPVRDSTDLKARSPLFHAERIKTPLMVVQGANDPRVTKLESDQLVTALRDRGVQVTYLVAENEGHGFLNADNRMALYRSMELFLAQHLGGRASPTTKPEIEATIRRLTVDVEKMKPSAVP
jgi:dipeptidyl aminopeptidase/acylaminoacyl peptidase